ncbi:hypothetical protein ACFQ4M_06450 [Thauera mechernichensis]|uniref:EF-hand domain-containing protein n=1 Tax=Thauera mechernichensis TaxID=82788 RepID=A0ABW3WBH0_9RHOO|nr:hypothetical protein [Thauera mechernichensis]MDG3065737.1 hypothetical protein [Thauera mechernichensis]
MSTQGDNKKPYQWRFFRSGGFDQVRIETADDLRHLGELDQKLWSVLACPTSGLEFDTRTLQLLDADGDGRIRAPEIVAAVRWVCAVLKEPEVLFRAPAALPLAAIDGEHPEGARLLATARKVLAYVDKSDAESISVEDLADTTRLFAPDHFNGDGVVPAGLTTDAGVVKAIGHIIDCFGAVDDRSGTPGVDAGKVETFFAAAQAVSDWQALAEADPARILPLGAGTAAAAAVFDAVADKVGDFFTRCRLAAFDARAADALNPADSVYQGLAEQVLAAGSDGVAALPLARVEPGRALPLAAGLNPAWEARIAALREQVVAPILGDRDALSQAEWQDLAARFAAWRDWQAAQPASPVVAIPVDELRALLGGSVQADLLALIEQDLRAETAAAQVDALERLVRYQRDLVTLLRNFVTLSDFYGAQAKAIFQAGTLYLDQRSCDLCLRVADMGRHSALAPLSGTYLVYCNCARQGEAPMTIVAAMTGGDADEMMVPGRNGVFYDRQGRDWNASVVQVVEAPISVRQAFWSPYKRVARMIGEQIQKFAASRDKAVEERAAAGVADAGAKVEAPAAAPAAPAQAFDIAKFAGIFAAIGLALGALGTALAAVVSGFLSLPAWQMPLVVVGIVLLISGPSMLMAWLKLRQRNLGPLLDANGWAVNTRARINIPFGAALTGVAALPPGAARSLSDPYAEKQRPWGTWMFLLLVIAIAILLWRQGVYDQFLG